MWVFITVSLSRFFLRSQFHSTVGVSFTSAARYITSPSRPRGKNSGCSAPGAMSWAVGLRGSLGTLWIFNIAIENHHL